MTARALSLFLLLGLGSGCRDRGLTALATDLSVEPGHDFGVVYVGFARSGRVEVSNRGRGSVDFVVTTPAPFRAAERFTVPGGTTLGLEVQLIALAEGEVSGSLRLEAPGLNGFDVLLTGVGALPPMCVATNDCLEARFDPDSGCVETPQADGASCGANDRCVTGGHCQQGACVGLSVTCDDGNACTTDACSPLQGCLHSVVRCQQPLGACQAAVCEPATGCGVQAASDGARCGDNDCQVAHVCIAGACEQRAAPDGSECGEASTCRGAGTCSLGSCEPSPPHVPQPRWHYDPPGGMNVMRVGVDLSGNTFVLLGTDVVYAEDAGPPAYALWLLSFDVDGRSRFRVNLTQQTAGLENGLGLMIDPDTDRLYLAARTYNYGTATPRRVVVAQARSASTGALLWQHDLQQGIAVYSSTSGELWLDVTRMMLLEPGVLSLALVEGEALHQAYVVGLSTASGAELWKQQRSGHMSTGASGNGDVWENSAACWSSESSTSRISKTGVSSGQLPGWVGFVAFDRDRALVRTSTTSQLAWLSPSMALTPLPLPTQHSLEWSSAARIEGSLVTVLTRDEQRGEASLNRYDSTSGTWQWSAPLGVMDPSQLWLLRDGGTATSLSLGDGGTELVTHDATGAEVERCPYGPTFGVAVTNGLYVTQEGGGLSVFDVPGREAATSGWTGPNGFAGTGRAR